MVTRQLPTAHQNFPVEWVRDHSSMEDELSSPISQPARYDVEVWYWTALAAALVTIRLLYPAPDWQRTPPLQASTNLEHIERRETSAPESNSPRSDESGSRVVHRNRHPAE